MHLWKTPTQDKHKPHWKEHVRKTLAVKWTSSVTPPLKSRVSKQYISSSAMPVFRFLQSQALYFQWLIVAVTSQSHVTSSGTSWARHTDWWTKRSWGGRACARLSRTRTKSKDCRRHRASCTVIINVIMTWLLTNTTAIHVNLAGAETKVEGSASAALRGKSRLRPRGSK